MKMSEIVRERLERNNVPYFANDNISEYLAEDEYKLLQEEVEQKMQELLESMVIDTKRDHNTQETAKRVAKMYMTEVFQGRYKNPPKVTDFPNGKNLDELYILGPITVRSACSHHLVPILGKIWVGVLPSDRVIGISKFNRIVNWIMRRPHIQEEATIMVADKLEELMKPIGLGIVMKAQHLCMTWRGVEETETMMMTSVMRGAMREKPALKAEFLSMIKE